MATGIITLLVAVVTFAVWLIKRKANQNDDPREIRAEAILRADAAIAAGPSGEDDVNRLVDAAVAPSAGPVDRRMPESSGSSDPR